MRATRVAILILAGSAVVGLSACNSIRSAVGATRVAPDEFRVVAIAPLTVPPDYSLRPPTPGEPRPQELQPEGAARAAILGANAARQASDGEKLLIAKAGGDKADPLIKFVVDDEFGDLAYKDKSFADAVMFWSPDQPVQASAGGGAPAPIDPAAETARIAALTGGQPVVIVRAPEPARRRLKLPGL